MNIEELYELIDEKCDEGLTSLEEVEDEYEEKRLEGFVEALQLVLHLIEDMSGEQEL